MKYYFFIDETGDHGLSYIDKNFPIFLLCGCLVSEKSLIEIEKSILALKLNFFKSTEVIIHSRDIRKCEGAFQVLFDLNLKKSFYEELNRIMKDSKYCLIGSAIEKEDYIKRYGKGANDPYSLSLSFIIERMVFYFDKHNSNAKVDILIEERGWREDKELLSHFNSLVDRGTYYIESRRLKNKINKFTFHNKRDNIIGLQLADLCAYPLARHIINPRVPSTPFSLIEDKIYCDDSGKYQGWGLKVFP